MYTNHFSHPTLLPDTQKISAKIRAFSIFINITIVTYFPKYVKFSIIIHLIAHTKNTTINIYSILKFQDFQHPKIFTYHNNKTHQNHKKKYDLSFSHLNLRAPTTLNSVVGYEELPSKKYKR